MKRSASAAWSGGLKDGKGTVSTESGVLSAVPYNFSKRFENEKGTNPEELIAAAHAACFSMALSNGLAQAGTPPTSLATAATVTFVPGTGITKSALEVRGDVPGVDEAAFGEAAEQAKENCPVSQALKGNVEFTLDAQLTSP
jgi:osmotically inducible protein OsmC